MKRELKLRLVWAFGVCLLTMGAVQGGWNLAEMIETDNAGDATWPQIAADSNGNSVAVWQQSDGTRNNIWSNRYVAGSGWQTAELIETNNTAGAYRAQVTMDGNGNAIAVWYQSDGTRHNIWSNRYTPGSGWATAELLETDNAGNAVYCEIAANNSGNAVAVWHQSDGIRDNIWANRYDPVSGWQTAELVEMNDAGNARYSQVAIDDNGNAIAVWVQSNGTQTNIWSNRYLTGSGWQTPQQIQTGDVSLSPIFQVAGNTGGDAIVVWFQNDGVRNNIWSNLYTAGTGWGTPVQIETSDFSAYYPKVAFDNAGNAIVIWAQESEVILNIWSNRHVAGSGWQMAELVDSGDAREPKIAMDINGNAIAVWEEWNQTVDIKANRYTPGVGWGSAELIETDNAGDARLPEVAVGGDRTAIAVWYQPEGTVKNIWSNRYEGLLAPLSATAFTYQGRLLDDNAAASGVYDMQFKLYDDPNAAVGNQIGPDVLSDDVDVIDGYFIAQLDFGGTAFDGDARWLQIAVRPGASSNPEDFVNLEPLQPLTAAPYAVQCYQETDPTVDASVKDGVSWDELSDLPAGFADNVDDTGLTTETDPTVPADIKDGVSWAEILGIPAGFSDDVDNDTQLTEAQVDTYVANNGYLTAETDPVFVASSASAITGSQITNWNTAYGWGNHALAGYLAVESDPTVPATIKDGISWNELTDIPAGFADNIDDTGGGTDSDWTLNGNDMYSGVTGNVGIGTSTPTAKLDVNGDIDADNLPGCDVSATYSLTNINDYVWRNAANVQLTVNAPGYAIVTFEGYVVMFGSNGVQVGIGQTGSNSDYLLECGGGSGNVIPFCVQHVYAVGAAGTYTYYGNAIWAGGTTGAYSNIFQAKMIAIYVPNRY